jgi:D-glycero-D-manno-heptose 1,7-bisphosphate phosphatase
MSGRPGVFLDRDGTLIDELGYLGDPAGVRLYPGAARAVRALNAAGLPVVLVTNQSGVARGMFAEADVHAVHARLAELLRAEGARLDLVLFCPHHPREGLSPYRVPCECRKPAPGMYLAGARALGLDLAHSAVVGDSERDLEAGRRAGIGQLILVATGKGRGEDARLRAAGPVAHALAEDLERAAGLVLARQGEDRQGR